MFVLVVSLVFGINLLARYAMDINHNDSADDWSASQSSEEQMENDSINSAGDITNEPVELPPAIDLSSVVENWASTVYGNKSVAIYDLDRNEWVVKYNSTGDYNTASLYKLFVVYEGYKLLNEGEWQADSPAGSTGHTILECLDLAIRESNSVCAETLWGKIGRNRLDDIIINEWGIKDSNISAFVSNAEDILRMMRRFYRHPDITDEKLLARMWDSFLIQPITEYNWRQGLPSGFSDNVEVYNKVGWDYNVDDSYWNIYHDAAIVHFKDLDRTFIVVVMTNKVDYHKIKELGTMVENAVTNELL